MKHIPLTLVALLSPLAASAAGVAFTESPAVERQGDAMRVTFAVSATTDVEVAVLDRNRRVVRRLVAGCLGPNAPAPLRKDSLRQEIVWDGRDDTGLVIPPDSGLAPFSIRVAAGMSVTHAGAAFGSELKPDDLTNVIGLGMGADGRLHVLSERWKRAWWTATAMHLFARSGAYEKTIKPFPASLPTNKVAAITRVQNEKGNPLPTIYRVLSMDYYPTEDVPQHPAVDREGNVHLLVIRAAYHRDREEGERYLATIGPDGGIPFETYAGPKFSGSGTPGDPYLVASSDGKSVFVTGIDRGPGEESARRPNGPAVYRVDLPARADATPFFGHKTQTGADNAHLADPRGLAIDGKGRLLVADRGNNRVVILSETNGAFLGSFDVPDPTWLAVHRSSGAIYVASDNAVIGFALSPDDKPKEKGRLALPALGEKEKKSNRWSFALDSSLEPAVLWVGHNRGGDNVLMRAEEADGQFTKLAPASCRPARTYWNIASAQDGHTVACKVGWRNLRFFDEETAQTREITLPDSGGQTYRLGPNNQIYGIDHWRWGVRRWDKDGKPLPFPATLSHPDKEGQGRLTNAPSGTTSWERDFDVDRSGNVYVKHRGKIYHGRMRVDKYDKDGNFLDTLIWVVSDGAHGPRVDAAGNIYIADAVKPPGQPYPDFFKDRLLPARIDKRGSPAQQYTWMYGSVIKFGPPGGAIWFPIIDPQFVYAFDGEARLPADQPRTPVDTAPGDVAKWAKPGEIQGALWYRYGVSYILDMHPGHNRRCHCTATDFDVDDYGRIYYTDQGRFRVVVLDTAGNEILAFGSYGNQDSCGPEIAFNWFTGLGATERSIYVADGLNRRVIRAGIRYAAEATVEAK